MLGTPPLSILLSNLDEQQIDAVELSDSGASFSYEIMGKTELGTTQAMLSASSTRGGDELEEIAFFTGTGLHASWQSSIKAAPGRSRSFDVKINGEIEGDVSVKFELNFDVLDKCCSGSKFFAFRVFQADGLKVINETHTLNFPFRSGGGCLAVKGIMSVTATTKTTNNTEATTNARADITITVQ